MTYNVFGGTLNPAQPNPFFIYLRLYIHGLGRLDLIHIFMLRKSKFMCKTYQGSNTLMHNLLWCYIVLVLMTYYVLFTVRRSALHGLCDRNSVCLSVRLSHSCTVSTWFDLRS